MIVEKCYNLIAKDKSAIYYSLGGITMLYEYLINNYNMGEPIFLADIEIPNISNGSLRQMLKKLCDQGRLVRYEGGIYYLPLQSRLKGGNSLPAEMVAKYKYISRKGRINGYYSGFTFANQLGITNQVPYTTEIATNNSGGKFREVNIKGQRIILRKPKVTINEENYKILQILDLLKDISVYADEINLESMDKITKYIASSNIKKESLDKCLSQYPDKVFRTIYEMRLYNVLAQ